MIKAADKLAVGRRRKPNAWQASGSAILATVVVAWILAMIVSLRERFLDRFVVGTIIGNFGGDFFQMPRGFRNLMAGSNIFLTELDDYGPYATAFLSHPIVAVAIGSWTAPLPPWTAYGLFVAVSLALLAIGAGALAQQFEGRLLRVFTFFALFCSLPTYLMLWNAQIHVLLVLAVALMLAGLVGLDRDEQGSTQSLRMLQIGLLISLLSKPAALLTLPVLFATRETRRALIVPIAIYAAISLLFLLTPALNSGGYDGAHWLNLINASSSSKPVYSVAFAREIDYADNPEIFGLPMYLQRLTGSPVPQAVLKLPLLAVLAMSLLPLFLASRRRRIEVLLATVMLCFLSHFLCYYVVWEYHYTTLLPMLPVLWWMSQREDRATLRWLLRIAFAVLLANFLPTLFFLAPQTPMRFAAASTLLRVVPVVISFACLLLYGIGSAWAALQEAPRGVELPRGQLPDLIKTGAALAISCGAVLACALLTVPERLTKLPQYWTSNEWKTHYEDLLARPCRGIDPRAQGEMHYLVGASYFDSDRPLALKHYAAAIELVSADPDLLCGMGDRMLRGMQIDLAIAAYRRALQISPNHEEARAKLSELKEFAPTEGK